MDRPRVDTVKEMCVGFDATHSAANAVHWAVRVAAPLGAEVIVVDAAPDPRKVRRQAGELEMLLDDVRRELGDPAPNVRAEHVPRPLTDALVERAGKDVDLVVGCSDGGHGRHNVRTVEAIVRAASRPVIVVGAETRAAPRGIVLGLDGSDWAVSASSWCATLASHLDASVAAVTVFEQPFELLTESDPKSNFQYVKREINGAWIAPLRDAGVRVQPELVKSVHVGDALVDVARRVGAELIVVGKRGLVPRRRGTLGTTAVHLLHSSPIPVAFVPALG